MTISFDSDGYDSGLSLGIELAAQHFSNDHILLLSDGIPKAYNSVRDFLTAEYDAAAVDATAATASDDETAYWKDWDRGFLDGVRQIKDAMTAKQKADRKAAAAA